MKKLITWFTLFLLPFIFLFQSCGVEFWNRTTTSSSSSSSSSSSELDTNFGTSGKVILNSGALFAAMTISDKAIVAGKIDNGSGSDIFIARIYENGTLDSMFGANSNGTVILDNGTNDIAYGLLPGDSGAQPTLAGVTDNSTDYDFLIASVDTSGNFVSTFGGTGVITSDVTGTNAVDNATSVATVTEMGTTYRYIAGVTNSNANVLRYNNLGVLDTGFSGDGRLDNVLSASGGGKIESIVATQNGTIIALGTLDNDFALARFDNSGSFPSVFGTNGRVTTDIGTSSTDRLSGATLIQNYSGLNDAILAAGTSNDNFTVALYWVDNGSLVTAFGDDGKVTTPLSSTAEATAVAVTATPPKYAYVVGGVKSGSVDQFAVVSYAITDGSLNTNFSTDGKVELDVSGSGASNKAYDVAVVGATPSDPTIIVVGQSDGKMIIVGF